MDERVHDNPKDTKKLIQRFKSTDRFKRSPETLAIVNAKHAALKVLDLVLTFQENSRLAAFTAKFKECELSEAQARRKKAQHPMVPALYESFDAFDTKRSAKSKQNTMRKDLRAMFDDCSRFLDCDSLTTILIDLAHYEYDPIMELSLQVLNKLYSAKSIMFEQAINSLVLATPDSCRVHREVSKQVPLLRMMARSKWTLEQAAKMQTILRELYGQCHLPKAEEEPHPMNQRLMISHSVLEVVFDILATETDAALSANREATVGVLRWAVRLMKALTMQYEGVQQQVFHNLDNLLKVRLVESDLAIALKEAFSNNQELCLKILPIQILKIVYLIADSQERAPEYLELLAAIVKVEGTGLALKRNQTLVMKYIMQNYSRVAYILEQCSPADRMEVLNGDRGADHCQYLVSLIDLLATCAEGENRYIESLCQTILTADEILTILTDPNVENHLKRPFLRYMLNAYMKSSSGSGESRSLDIIHDSESWKMWEYIDHLSRELQALAYWIRDDADKDTVYFMSNKPFPKIMRLHDTCPLCSSLVAEDESKPLKLNLENAVVKMREDDYRGHSSLHYVFDAVLPFLQAFSQKFLCSDEEKDLSKERDIFDRLASAVVEFCSQLAGIIVDPQHLTKIISCLSGLVKKSSHSPAIMEPVVDSVGKGKRLLDTVSQMKSGNKEYYEHEIQLNTKLKALAVNMSLLCGGHNTVKAQLKFNSDREYTQVGSDEALPLDEEFQNHVRCFVSQASRKPEHRYKLAVLLVNGLRIGSVSPVAGVAKSSDEVKLCREQERLTIRNLQILRAIIHNEERRLPEDWEVRTSEFRVKKGLRTIADIQVTLNSFELVKHALPHLASANSQIAKEVLSLLGMMLFNANERVQESMLYYFLHTKEEVFFYAVRNRLQMSAANIKERRLLISQQRARQTESKSQADTLRATMTLGVKALHRIQQYRMEARLEQGSQDLTRRVSLSQMQTASISKKRRGKDKGQAAAAAASAEEEQARDLTGKSGSSLSKKKPKKSVAFANGQAEMAEQGLLPDAGDAPDSASQSESAPAPPPAVEEASETISMKDDGYIALVLKVLASICDGQHFGLQNYLREQPDNVKSFNLVAEVSQFINVAYSNINADTIDLLVQLFSTVNEFCAGNQENRATVYDNKIIDFINFILRSSNFENCEQEQIVNLRQTIANLVVSLIEENSPEALVIAREVKDTLDKGAVYRVMTESYEAQQRDSRFGAGEASFCARLFGRDEDKELKEAIYSVGFSYYLILARLYDIDPAIGGKKRRKPVDLQITEAQQKAFKFFKKNAMTIEILKNDNLQKVHFRVKNKNLLREELKEKVKWNVDRSSPSTKIRDFMDWAKAILRDIQYQKKVLSNPIAIVLTRLWLVWNHAATLLALMLNFMMLAGLEGRGEPPPLPRGVRDFVHAPNQNETWQWKSEYPRLPGWMAILGYVMNGLSLVILLAFFVANHPKLPNPMAAVKRLRNWRSGKTKRSDQEEEEADNDEDKLSVSLLSFASIYYVAFVGFALAGTFICPYFFAFHLLNIVNGNQLLRGVIQAVTVNGLSLIWVSVLGIAVMYLYSVLAFAFFRSNFDSSDNMFCSDMYQCFMSVLRFGLIGDLFGVLQPPEGQRDFANYFWVSIFHISFFICISTIGLNIVLGIIVDTFSELRNMKWTAEVDMRDNCFICSRNNYDFEHHGQGFEYHVRNEHNMWAYVFFFIHLEDTAHNDYTSLDLHVHRLLKEEKFDFFPLNRALCLSAMDEDSTESKLDDMLLFVKELVHHQKAEEQERRRWIELNRQRKWQRRVLGQPPNHAEGEDEEEEEEDAANYLAVPRSASGSFRPGSAGQAQQHRPASVTSEEDYRVAVSQPDLSVGEGQPQQAEEAAQHLEFLDEYDENGEPRPRQ